MTPKTARVTGVCLALGTGVLAGHAPGYAQDQPFGPMVMEEVVVIAPRVVRRERVDRTTGGGTVERVTLTRRVSYADLDLRMNADVMELERRVAGMAVEACEQLAEAHPMLDPEPSHEDCIEEATEGAMERVREAVAAAER